MSESKTFQHFNSLPPELRLVIWEQAIHETSGYQACGPAPPANQPRTTWTSEWEVPGIMSELNIVYCGYFLDKRDQIGSIQLKDNGKGFFFPRASGLPGLLHACRDSRVVALKQLRHRFLEFEPHINPAEDRSSVEDEVAEFFDDGLGIIDKLLEEMKMMGKVK